MTTKPLLTAFCKQCRSTFVQKRRWQDFCRPACRTQHFLDLKNLAHQRVQEKLAFFEAENEALRAELAALKLERKS